MYHVIDVNHKEIDNQLSDMFAYITKLKIPKDCVLHIRIILNALQQWVVLIKQHEDYHTPKNIQDAFLHFANRLQTKLDELKINDVFYTNIIEKIKQCSGKSTL